MDVLVIDRVTSLCINPTHMKSALIEMIIKMLRPNLCANRQGPSHSTRMWLRMWVCLFHPLWVAHGRGCPSRVLRKLEDESVIHNGEKRFNVPRLCEKVNTHLVIICGKKWESCVQSMKLGQKSQRGAAKTWHRMGKRIGARAAWQPMRMQSCLLDWTNQNSGW